MKEEVKMNSKEWRQKNKLESIDEQKINENKIRQYVIEQIKNMKNGEKINFAQLMSFAEQHVPSIKLNESARKRIQHTIETQLHSLKLISRMQDGNYRKDEYQDIQGLEEANQKEQEAIKIAKEIVENLKKRGKVVSKKAILEELKRDFLKNDRYQLFIKILCDIGAIPGVPKDIGEVEQEL